MSNVHGGQGQNGDSDKVKPCFRHKNKSRKSAASYSTGTVPRNANSKNLSFKQMKKSNLKVDCSKISINGDYPSSDEIDNEPRVAKLEEILFQTKHSPAASKDDWSFPKYFIISHSYHDLNEFCTKIVPLEGPSNFKYIFMKFVYDKAVLHRPTGTLGCPPKFLLFGTLEMLMVVSYPLKRGVMLKGIHRVMKQNGLIKFLWTIEAPNSARSGTTTVLDTEVKSFLDVSMLYDMLDYQHKNQTKENHLYREGLSNDFSLIPKDIVDSPCWNSFPSHIVHRKDEILSEVNEFCADIIAFRCLFREEQPLLFNFPTEQLLKYDNYYHK